ERAERFTPTCVGTMSRPIAARRRTPVHPHVRGDDAPREMCGEHGWPRLFQLEEEWVVRILPLEQGDVAPCADTSDTDNLAGSIHEVVAVEQLAVILPQRLPVGVEDLPHALVLARAVEAHDERWILND